MSGMDKIDINEITAERMLDPVFAARVRAAVKQELESEEDKFTADLHVYRETLTSLRELIPRVESGADNIAVVTWSYRAGIITWKETMDMLPFLWRETPWDHRVAALERELGG